MNLDSLIGHTPMIKINYQQGEQIKYIYAKLEYYNFTGSIKDRIVYAILNHDTEIGKLKEHQPIIEVSSGNTGISFAAIGDLLQHEVHIFMPDWVSIERQKLLAMYGAKLHLVSREEGGFREALIRADKYAEEIHGYRPNQFENEVNMLAHYEGTGAEIIQKLPQVKAFISGIGTGGTLMGVGKKLKEWNPHAKLYALEPATLPILSCGITTGKHKIEGIGDDFIPPIVSREEIDDIVLIPDDDAINMARKLALNLGLGVGISSGANFLGAVLKNEKNKIVTVFPDSNMKYISTELSKPIQTTPNLLSNQIQLLSLEEV